jgi:RNA polymerase sigma-70 factor (ECF subfamily)
MDTIDFNISARAYLYKTVYHASLDFLKHKKITQKYENDTMKNGNAIMHVVPVEEKELQRKLYYGSATSLLFFCKIFYLNYILL